MWLEQLVPIFLSIIAQSASYIVQPGPLVIPTKGDVWPKPQYQVKSQDYFVLKPDNFKFNITGEVGCPDFLNDALNRYWKIIVHTGSPNIRDQEYVAGKWRHHRYNKFWLHDESFLAYLDTVNIQLTGKCADEDVRIELGSAENYSISITAMDNTISAPTIWGILRGLETFSQIIYLENDTIILNSTIIHDYPRFPHRGLLLDTSRHFIPVYAIYDTLNAMAYNKFNVFHWHIVDDQSFPYQSKVFPELSDQGAYHPINKVYDQTDIKNIIEYARLRGIRIIPEFDTPGHTRSWGVSHPEVLTQCYTDNKPDGNLGPMDPSKKETYDLLTKLFAEVVDVFPDAYFHIGGDEVDYDCWQSNPKITKFMEQNNITTYKNLESFFIQNVVDILNNLKAKYLVWEEVFVNGVTIPNSTVVHVWKQSGLLTLYLATAAGKKALYSSCWYLDHLETGGDWVKYYDCDPLSFPGTQEQKNLVLGGEACMWSESVNEYNLMSRVWPRASAAAEKLWSSAAVTDLLNARKRLEEHTCRMNYRGIQAQPPNGPGVCL